jgi:hypothetical protein
MPRWNTVLRVPKRLTRMVAKHLRSQRKMIETKYKQIVSDDSIPIKVVEIEARALSVVVRCEGAEIKVNCLSDAIMAYLPDDCHDIKVPYWS